MKTGPVKTIALLLASAVLALPGGLAAQPAPDHPAPAAGPPAQQDADTDAPRDEAFAFTPDLPSDTPPELVAEMKGQAPVTALPEALRRTYWTSPVLLANRAAARSVDWRVPQARSGYGPHVTAVGTYGWQRDNFEVVSGIFVPRRGWTSTARAVLTQPLYTFGRTFASERVATMQHQFQTAQLATAEQQAMLDAITAYVGVLRDRTGVGIARDNLALLEQEQSDNGQRLKVREVTVTDLQQVVTRVEFGRAQLLAARRAAASSEAVFLRAVGAPAGAVAAPPAIELPVRTLEEAYAWGELHSPVIAAAKAREQISRAQVAAARAEMRPRVDLRGTAEYGTVTPYTNDLRETNLRGEVSVTAPIYQGGQLSSRVSELKAANDADWHLLDSALRDNRAAIADAWSEWQQQLGSVDRLAAAVDSARQAYDGALLQEKAGLRTTLDVLDLARELLSARTSYNTAVADVTIAKAKLLQAMGSLDYGWLQPDASRYDAEGHFRQVRHRGDLPLLTPLARALDGIASGRPTPRPIRDPAARTTTPGMTADEGAPNR